MALLPPFYLDSVVALGVGDDQANRRWIGTGFLYGNLIVSGQPAAEKRYNVWLITNKHVLAALSDVYMKLNSAADTKSKDYRVPLVARNGKQLWVGHPNGDTDVAAVWLNAGFLAQEQLRFSPILSDVHTCTKDRMKTGILNEGDRVFVLGFPMGLVAAERQYVICRSGIIARIRDYLEDRTKDYLVDAPVFPGNSGGPVVVCPAVLSIQGTKRPERADLIGMVKSYVPYRDVAISSQTQRPRITFEENSGLTAVEPMDAIVETVALAERRLKGRHAQAKFQAKKRAQTQVVEQAVGADGDTGSPEVTPTRTAAQPGR
jgi:trypsin-like peptidase